MFDREFFPTPSRIAFKMWMEVRNCSYILEPSAGKGDLLAPGKEERQRGYGPRVDVIERNPELQLILRGSGYNLVHDDFLTFEPHRKYDGIVMNPPFSVGAEHLLHAWSILSSGKIVCLLNSETVANRGVKARKLLGGIIDQHGEVMDLGKCFVGAERSAGVNVCMVVLKKEDDGQEFGFFDEVATERKGVSFGLEESSATDLASFDTIDTMVGMYQRALGAYGELLRAKNKAMFYVKHLTSRISQESLLTSNLRGDQVQYNQFVDELTEKCWDEVFERTDIQRFVTSGVRKDFEKFRDGNKVVDFSRRNVEFMIQTLGASAPAIMEEALLRVFDELTRYDKKNTCHWEGWKTNDAWRVNRKVIIPHVLEVGRFTDRPCFSYYSREILDDLDRVMCSLTGKNYAEISTVRGALQEVFNTGEWEHVVKSEFFGPIRYYKKGTVHLSFKDESLLANFNRAAAKGKNWLPGER